MDADDRPLPFFGPNANPHSASCRSTRSDGKCGLDWTYAGGVHYVILQPDRKQAAVIVGHQREVHSSWAFTAGNWVFEIKREIPIYSLITLVADLSMYLVSHC